MHHNMMRADEEGYTMGINMFADLTEKEFKMKLGFNNYMPQSDQVQYVDNENVTVPDAFDWKDAVPGVLNPIKD